jgi:hypothetical protein
MIMAKRMKKKKRSNKNHVGNFLILNPEYGRLCDTIVRRLSKDGIATEKYMTPYDTILAVFLYAAVTSVEGHSTGDALTNQGLPTNIMVSGIHKNTDFVELYYGIIAGMLGMKISGLDNDDIDGVHPLYTYITKSTMCDKDLSMNEYLALRKRFTLHLSDYFGRNARIESDDMEKLFDLHGEYVVFEDYDPFTLEKCIQYFIEKIGDTCAGRSTRDAVLYVRNAYKEIGFGLPPSTRNWDMNGVNLDNIGKAVFDLFLKHNGDLSEILKLITTTQFSGPTTFSIMKLTSVFNQLYCRRAYKFDNEIYDMISSESSDAMIEYLDDAAFWVGIKDTAFKIILPEELRNKFGIEEVSLSAHSQISSGDFADLVSIMSKKTDGPITVVALAKYDTGRSEIILANPIISEIVLPFLYHLQNGNFLDSISTKTVVGDTRSQSTIVSNLDPKMIYSTRRKPTVVNRSLKSEVKSRMVALSRDVKGRIAHWRRGHYRHVAVGKRSENRRELRYINPTFVRGWIKE